MRPMIRAVSALVLAALAGAASAQGPASGLGSIAEVHVDAAKTYRFDGRAIPLARLSGQLDTLDRQMPVDRLHLRAGRAAVTETEVAEIAPVAARIGARLFVERDGRLEAVDGVP